MKRKRVWMVPAAALLTATACLGAALAAGGQEDPLITLSYLNNTLLPALIQQVDEQGAQRQEELKEQFQKDIDGYKAEMEQLLQTSAGAGNASFAVLTLSQGQQLKLGVGCEVMLRVGRATLITQSSPGLIDSTTGGSLENGAALEKNHLYMATIEDRAIQAADATVKLLIRGSYSLD